MYRRNHVVIVAILTQSAKVMLIVVLKLGGSTKFGTTPGGGAKAGNRASSAGVGSIFAAVDMNYAIAAKQAQVKIVNHKGERSEQQWSNTISAQAPCG